VKEETKWLKSLLPDHYTCEPRDRGVHCYSSIGIDENDPEQWDFTVKAIKQKFGKRFMGIFHQTCHNHVKFTVFIRPQKQ
jgi:hypothetical protein